MDPRLRLQSIARLQDSYGYGAQGAKEGHAPSNYALWMGAMMKKGYTMKDASKFWDKKKHAPKSGAPGRYSSQRLCEEKCQLEAKKKKARKQQVKRRNV